MAISDWISLSNTSGYGGTSASVSVTALSNATSSGRSGNLKIHYGSSIGNENTALTKTVAISQTAAQEIYITLSVHSVTPTASSTAYTVNVDTNYSGVLQFNVRGNWLQTSFNSETYVLTVTVDENSTTSSRTGYVYAIAGSAMDTLTVTQAAAASEVLTINCNPSSIPASGSIVSLSVVSDAGTLWTIVLPSYMSAATLAGTGNAVIQAYCEANDTTLARTGTISISTSTKSASTTITQSVPHYMRFWTYPVSGTGVTGLTMNAVGTEPSTLSAQCYTNYAYEFYDSTYDTYDNFIPWISVTNTSASSYGYKQMVISVSGNPYNEARQADMYFYDPDDTGHTTPIGKLSIAQSANDVADRFYVYDDEDNAQGTYNCHYNYSRITKAYLGSSSAATLRFMVDNPGVNNEPYTTIVSTDVSWLDAAISSTTMDVLYIKALSGNTTGAERSGNVTITDEYGSWLYQIQVIQMKAETSADTYAVDFEMYSKENNTELFGEYVGLDYHYMFYDYDPASKKLGQLLYDASNYGFLIGATASNGADVEIPKSMWTDKHLYAIRFVLESPHNTRINLNLRDSEYEKDYGWIMPVKGQDADTSYLCYTHLAEYAPDDKIYYWSNTNSAVTNTTSSFGDAEIVSNTYSTTTGGCITFNTKLTEIGTSAFYAKGGFEKIYLPDSLTYIGNYAFNNCTGLAKIYVPDKVETIADNAFKNCSLELVSLGYGLESIGITAFANNGDPMAIKKYAHNSQSGETVTVPSLNAQTFKDVSYDGSLGIISNENTKDAYTDSDWMNTSQYYLGYYDWTISRLD